MQEVCILDCVRYNNMMLLTVVLDELWGLGEVHNVVVDEVAEVSGETFFGDSLFNHLEYALYVLAHLPYMFLPYLCLYNWLSLVLWVIPIQPNLGLTTQVNPNQVLVWYEWPMERLHRMKRSIRWPQYRVPITIRQPIHLRQLNRYKLSQDIGLAVIAQCRVLFNINIPNLNKVVSVLLVVPKPIMFQVLFFRYVVEFVCLT